MDHIIKKLDSKILQAWGFNYDLAYWTHPNYKFKLQLGNDGYTVFIMTGIDQANTLNIHSNGELFGLITQQFQPYLNTKLSESKFLNQESQLKFINETIKQYFSFDENISMALQISPVGLGLMPNNEYTHTLISGLECIFKIILKNKSGEVTEDTLYYHPNCISYGFLKELYPDCEIEAVKIQAVDDNWEPFYGTGIPRQQNT